MGVTKITQYFHLVPEFVQNKNVVDIGCGVGFLGITCAMLGAKRVVLTDGNMDVLTMAQQNIGYSKCYPPLAFKVNIFQEPDTISTPGLDEAPCPVSATALDWENFTNDQIASLKAEVLILSDLVTKEDLCSILEFDILSEYLTFNTSPRCS